LESANYFTFTFEFFEEVM